jgi:hypothetical protein
MTGWGANILYSGDQTYMLLPGQNWEFVNRVWSLWQSMTLNCWFRSTIGIAQESSLCGTCLVPNFSDSSYRKEERCPQISEDIILTQICSSVSWCVPGGVCTGDPQSQGEESS